MDYLDTLQKDGDVYLIASRDDLTGLADYVNDRNESCWRLTFKLACDLDLGGLNFTPIGKLDREFEGTFDGDNHTIKNLTINTTEDYQGLFGILRRGTIKNIILDSANVTGANCVGGLVGDSSRHRASTIENCTVINSTITGVDCVGGLAGFNNFINGASLINNCTVINTKVTGSSCVGGLAGFNDGVIVRSFADAIIIGKENFGGFVGISRYHISGCYFHSDTPDKYATRLFKLDLPEGKIIDVTADNNYKIKTFNGTIYYKGGATLSENKLTNDDNDATAIAIKDEETKSLIANGIYQISLSFTGKVEISDQGVSIAGDSFNLKLTKDDE